MGFDLSKLGVKKNIPKVDFKEYCGIIIAPPKYGKTTMASLYPNAIICAFELGYKSQVANVKDINNWDDLIAFNDLLEKNRKDIGDDIQTIVWDTVNEAHEMCSVYTLKKLSRLDGKKYTKPSDVPYGGFYTAWDREFKTQVDRQLKMGFMPLYLTHNKIKTITPKTGDAYDVYVSTMSERCEKIVYPAVDYIIHGEYKKVPDGVGGTALKRVMIVKGNDDATAGSRVYIDTDIVFDTEPEAIEKFQTEFKKVITERLRKAGITDSIEKLAKEQEEQKKKEVTEYLETNKLPSKEELVNEIKGKFATATSEAKTAVTTYLSEIKINTFADPERFEVEQLQRVLDILAG